MKILKILFYTAAAWYVLFGVILMLFEQQMVYFPNGQDFFQCKGFANAETIEYEGVRFYYKHVSTDKVVVFYHGNAGSACGRSALGNTFEQAGYSYLFAEYPGFSGDQHPPSKRSILEDVLHVRAFLAERGYTQIIPMGESLGSGVAAYHASLGGVKNVVLLTPYYELADMTGVLGKAYPIRYMMRENYTAGEWLKNVMEPVTVIYAERDEVIPYVSTKKLFAVLRSPAKKLIGVSGGTHNTMYEHESTFESIRSALRD